MPTTTLDFWIGDDPWQFNVEFEDDAGNPITLDPVSAKPEAEVFLGTQVAGIKLNIANGGAVITGNNTAVFTLTFAQYSVVSFSSATKPVFNRFQAYVVRGDGTRTTHRVVNINPHDPRTDALNTLPVNGSIVAVIGPQGPQGEPGIQGPPGPIASSVVYEYQPATVWVVAHNQGRYPSITLVDTSNDVLDGGVEYTNDNTITVTFSAATGGRAFIN